MYFDESQLTLLTIHFQLTHRVISDQGKHLEERYLIWVFFLKDENKEHRVRMFRSMEKGIEMEDNSERR